MPIAKLIAAAALVALVTAPREFGIGGGAILCVPEREIDADATPYAPSTKHLRDDGRPAFSFQIDAREVQRHVPRFSEESRPGDSRPASVLEGLVGFVSDRERQRYPLGVTCAPGHKTCARRTLIDGFLVEYDLQAQNLALGSDLDRFLAGKIAEWRDNCHATDRL